MIFRRTRRSVSLVLLLCLSSLLGSSLLGQKLTRGPYIQLGELDGKTGIVIAWFTEDRADSRVEVFPPDGAVRIFQDGGDVRHHIVPVTGLLPATRYEYRIRSDGKVLAEGLEFVTAPDDDREFRFGALGDSGEGTDSQWDVADELAGDRPDLVIHTGDVVYPDGEDKHYTAKFFDPYAEILRRVPFMPTIGNHDWNTDDAGPYLENFILPRGLTNVSKVRDEEAYSFDWGNVHFANINSEWRYEDIDVLARKILPWLREDLLASTKPWKVVYFHHPPYSDDRDHGDSLDIQRLVVPILEETRVNLVVNGHSHNYQRFKPMLGGKVQPEYEDGAICYIISGGGGSELYRINKSSRLAVAYDDDFSYSIFDVDGRSLRIRQVTRRGEEVDDVKLRQKSASEYEFLIREDGVGFFHLEDNDTQLGYAKLEESDRGERTALAWLRLVPGASNYLSAAPVGSQVPRKRHSLFIEETAVVYTNVSVANPESSDAILEFAAFDASGNRLTSASHRIAGEAQFAQSLRQLLPGLRRPFRGLVTIKSSQPVNAYSIQSVVTDGKVKLISVPPISDPSPGGAIPFAPSGPGMLGKVVLVNPHDETISGQVRFVETGSGQEELRSYQIRARGYAVLIIPSSKAGIWKVDLLPAGALQPEFMMFWQTNFPVGNPQSLVLLPRPRDEYNRFPVEVTSRQRVSFSVSNPSSDAVSVEVALWEQAGKWLDKEDFKLEANGSRVFYLDNLFPDMGTLFRGSVVLQGNDPILVEAFLSVMEGEETCVSAFPRFESSRSEELINLPLVAFQEDALETDVWVVNDDSRDREERMVLKKSSGGSLRVYQRY